MARRRFSGLLGISVLVWVMVGCGSDGGSAGSGTTVGTVETREANCGAGEQPAVTAFEAGSGAVRWIACSAELGYRSIAGASDDLVYVTTMPPTGGGPATTGGGPSLVALDTENGEEQWRASLGQAYFRIPSGPFSGGDVAVVVLTDGTMTADIVGLDPATGQTIWTTSGANGDYATNEDLVVGGGNTVAAYDRATGEQLWSIAQLGNYNTPVLSDDTVFFGTDPGAVALDLQSGEERWRTTDGPEGVPAGVEDGILVYSGQDDPTSGVDVATGEILWTQPGNSAYDDVFAIGDGAVYVFAYGEVGTDTEGPGESSIVAYEVATGEARWRHGLGPRGGQWPFWADDEYVVALWPNVLVLSTHDGSPRWSTPEVMGEMPRYTSAATNDDTVVVASSTEPSGGD